MNLKGSLMSSLVIHNSRGESVRIDFPQDREAQAELVTQFAGANGTADTFELWKLLESGRDYDVHVGDQDLPITAAGSLTISEPPVKKPFYKNWKCTSLIAGSYFLEKWHDVRSDSIEHEPAPQIRDLSAPNPEMNGDWRMGDYLPRTGAILLGAAAVYVCFFKNGPKIGPQRWRMPVSERIDRAPPERIELRESEEGIPLPLQILLFMLFLGGVAAAIIFGPKVPTPPPAGFAPGVLPGGSGRREPFA